MTAWFVMHTTTRFQDSCAPKVTLPNQDVRKLPIKFQTNSNNLSPKFGPWNFSDWRSGSHMAGCSPSESDGICWCSLIFLSSQANSSPNHIAGWAWGVHLRLHHLCGAGVHMETVRVLPGCHRSYFPFSPLSADGDQVPCVLHLKFGARWELAAQGLEASVMPSHSWCQRLQYRLKLSRVFAFPSIKAWLWCARHRGTVQTQQQLKAPHTTRGTAPEGQSSSSLHTHSWSLSAEPGTGVLFYCSGKHKREGEFVCGFVADTAFSTG